MSPPISPTSAAANTPAVNASNTGSGGVAVYGYSANGHGVEGRSDGSQGVVGRSTDFRGVYGHSDKNAGVVGESSTWVGVYGKSMGDTGIAVMGEARADAAARVSGNGTGVLGVSTHGHGVEGTSVGSQGVVGRSTDFRGVYGHSDKNAGVVGESSTWVGVYGKSMGDTGIAVMGEARADAAAGVSGNGTGVLGVSTHGAGVSAASERGEAIHAETHSPGMAAIAARNLNEQGTGAAVWAEKLGDAGNAGFFIGHVRVTRNLSVGGEIQMTGGDLAEQFGVAHESVATPGHVMVLVGDDQVRQSGTPYDTRVAGIVSGAGGYRPGLVLDARADTDRCSLALTGKVWCWVDADFAPVALGDLLTTSSTAGHAMRASDPARAFGAVIGKSLGTLTAGRALLPVLVGLR